VFQPQTYFLALVLMVLSMFCWGSWANTMKLCPGYRFQLFYWDFVVGLVAGVFLWGFSLGSFGTGGQSFWIEVMAIDRHHALLAIAGGAIFNVANLLLVAAIEVAGLAVAFPVGIGLALILGAVGSYIFSPQGNPWMLFGGIALVLAAILSDAVAYKLREAEHQALTRKGVVISLISGVLMGCFYPFVSRSMEGPGSVGPYAASLFFVIGVAICAIPVNLLLMRYPLDGRPPVAMNRYFAARGIWHVWGIVGGGIWCTGAVFNFVASRAHVVGPAVSYSIGQGATMISACWGVFVWKEFASAPRKATQYLALMFVLFLLGLTLIAVAPLFT
jgi:glucose uptake protein